MSKRYLFAIVVLSVMNATAVSSAEESPAEVPLNTWSDVERIVAVGDVHGDYGQFLKALEAGKVIDDKQHWIAGRTHLVQTGDIFDRGPDSRKAMDLLMQLEPQAASAGGMMHTLLGNHEVMVMTGDLRYTHPGEIAAFGGRAEFAAAVGPEGKYGQWLRTHNCLIKINDILFMHGGLSQQWMHLSLDKINQDVRTFLRTGGGDGGLVRSGGPLWYRGWAEHRSDALAALCDPVFKQYNVRHAVIAHTPQRGIMAFGGGRVICIDTGMSAAYGGPAAALVIDKGRFFSVHHGQVPVPLEVNYDHPEKSAEPPTKKKAA